MVIKCHFVFDDYFYNNGRRILKLPLIINNLFSMLTVKFLTKVYRLMAALKESVSCYWGTVCDGPPQLAVRIAAAIHSVSIPLNECHLTVSVVINNF